MKLVNEILNHNLFMKHYKEISRLEADRKYCKHGIEHLLDVARIAYILNLEEHKGLAKDVIYAAALLHDIGKDEQYKEKIPHHISSAKIAEQILKDCNQREEITCVIVSAIESHRDEKSLEKGALNELIYRADKLSRACFFCNRKKTCHWEDDKKNKEVIM